MAVSHCILSNLARLPKRLMAGDGLPPSSRVFLCKILDLVGGI